MSPEAGRAIGSAREVRCVTMSDRKRWTTSESGALRPYRSEPPARVRSLLPEEIRVVYQPIVDLDRRAIFAAEVLARCLRPELANPVHLFEHAALQSVTGRLGRMVREVAFEAPPDVPLFLNLHPHELSERWLVRPDDPMNFAAHPLYLEITESAALDHYELCRGALRELCARLGAKLVVDDFGAGYSNLIRIADLEPAIVKVDRSLVASVHSFPRRKKVLRHIVALCADIGAEVVAEGIETPDELDAILECGCRYGQGYLFARPANPMTGPVWPARDA